LPDGEHFLFLQRGVDRPGVYVRSLTDAAATFVVAADSDAILNQDHLFFVRGHDLLAVPFDPRRRVTAGDPTTIQKEVTRVSGYLSAFSVVANGTVAAVVGSPDSRRLAWFALNGERVAVVPDSEGYRSPVLSADGTRLTADRVDPRSGLSGVWVVDLKRGVGSQVSDAAAEHMNGAWSPEGRRLAFNQVSSNTAEVSDLATQHVTTLNLPKADDGVWGGVRDWTRDGRSLLVQRGSGRGDNDLWLVPVDGSTPRPLVATGAIEADGQFSPDGRWMAYSSNQSGRWETYMVPVASRGTPIKISNNGGLEARWRRDGRAIFYVGLDNTLTVVDVIDPAVPTLGSPRPLFKLPIEPLSNARNHYDVGPDGKHVLVVEEVRTNDPLAIAVLTDWHRAAPQ
jgi:dipeptidyl aminopeptidase/acylaminoacyl peptidase